MNNDDVKTTIDGILLKHLSAPFINRQLMTEDLAQAFIGLNRSPVIAIEGKDTEAASTILKKLGIVNKIQEMPAHVFVIDRSQIDDAFKALKESGVGFIVLDGIK